MQKSILTGLLVFCFCLTACQNSNQNAVPLGDRSALERLAEAYKELSKDLRLAPSSLRPDKKKDFIEKVFNRSGYNYLLTLKAVAKGFNKQEKLHRDLVELLFYAHERGWRPNKMGDIYSQEEMQLIKKIEGMR